MLYADGYALGFPPPAVVYASGVLNTWDVTNYVIKLQMQKQIPTLLQAFRKRLYEMKFGISVKLSSHQCWLSNVCLKLGWGRGVEWGLSRQQGKSDEQ